MAPGALYRDKKVSINKKVPMVIEISATLNTGHILTSIKSTTYENLSLSIRLPKAPDIIRIRLELNIGLVKKSSFLMDFRSNIAIKPTTTIDITIKNNVLFLKSPNAAPVFVTNVIWRMFSIIGMDSPTDKFFKIINLEY